MSIQSASIVTAENLTVGAQARRFTRDEFSPVSDLRQMGRNGVLVTFEDGTSTTVGRGASFQVLDA